MTVRPLPDDSHIAKYVKPSELRRDESDAPIGVLHIAFRIRAGDDSLSAAWLEYFPGPPADQLVAARAEMHANLSMKKTGRLAIGEVGTIKSACKAFGQSVRIVEEPEPGFPSHAAVRQFRDGDDELLQLLADEAWAEIVPV